MDMMLEQFKTIFDRPEKVKKLRETILDLAVRGKLVEQDPNDEPAEVLLEKIREEKERLIKEKKIKKEKPLAEISEEEKPFELPCGWKYIRIRELLENIHYGHTASAVSNDTGIKFVRITDIQNNTVQWSKVPFCEIDKRKLESCKLRNNDILIARTGGTIGKSFLVRNVSSVAVFASYLIRMIPLEISYAQYIKLFLETPTYWKQIIDKSQGTGQPNVNAVSLSELVIPLPPLQQQKRIVEKVDSLMTFCDKLEKALDKKVHYGELAAKSIFNAVGNVSTSEELEETLRFILLNFKDLSLGDNAVKELKNCILQLAVQGKLVPQDPNDEPAEVLLEKIREEKERLIKEKKIKKEKPLAEISEEEKPFELPNGWSFTRLANITIKIGAGSTPKGGKNVYLDQGIKFIRSQNVYNNELFINDVAYINDEIHDKMSGSKVEAKDLLMNITGGSIGRCCIVPDDFDTGNVNQHVSIVRIIDKKIIKYIHLVLTSPYIFNTIMKMQVGISREGLSISKLSTFIIPIPPLEEQKLIVEKVDSLMTLCDELESKIQKQKDYSNRLMESILKSSF